MAVVSIPEKLVVTPTPGTGAASVELPFLTAAVSAGFGKGEIHRFNGVVDPVFWGGINWSAATGQPANPAEPAVGVFVEYNYADTIEVYAKVQLVGRPEFRPFGFTVHRTTGELGVTVNTNSLTWCTGETPPRVTAHMDPGGLILAAGRRLQVGDDLVVGGRVKGLKSPVGPGAGQTTPALDAGRPDLRVLTETVITLLRLLGKSPHDNGGVGHGLLELG